MERFSSHIQHTAMKGVFGRYLIILDFRNIDWHKIGQYEYTIPKCLFQLLYATENILL